MTEVQDRNFHTHESLSLVLEIRMMIYVFGLADDGDPLVLLDSSRPASILLSGFIASIWKLLGVLITGSG